LTLILVFAANDQEELFTVFFFLKTEVLSSQQSVLAHQWVSGTPIKCYTALLLKVLSPFFSLF
jgi:hypothetical protein